MGALIRAIIAASVVTLGACADEVWRNRKVTNEQAQMDMAACRLVAMPYGPFDRPGAISNCMQAKGYHQEPR